MKYFFSSLLVVLLSGCGSDTQESSLNQNQNMDESQSSIEMEIDKNYTVNKGDKLIKTSDDAKVSITKMAQEDTSTVVLLEGTAQIQRK